jgi:hypothetical protein
MEYLLYIHIIAGFTGLTLFWIPALTRKGGNLHRKVGKIYVRFMWITVLSAFVLSVGNMMEGRMVQGIFLGFIAMITANPLWYGMAVLQHKNGLSTAFVSRHLAFRGVIILAACAMIIYGVLGVKSGSAILLYIFGALGLTDLPRWLKEFRTRGGTKSWFSEHLIAMYTSGIAAFTAFLVFGANNYLNEVLSGYWAVVPWILPTVIGTIAIIRSIKHWKAKGAIR